MCTWIVGSKSPLGEQSQSAVSNNLIIDVARLIMIYPLFTGASPKLIREVHTFKMTRYLECRASIRNVVLNNVDLGPDHNRFRRCLYGVNDLIIGRKKGKFNDL